MIKDGQFVQLILNGIFSWQDVFFLSLAMLHLLHLQQYDYT